MKKIKTNSLMLDGKSCPIDEFFLSMPSPKGKWLKLEAYYKVKQRSNKILVDELKITRIKL